MEGTEGQRAGAPVHHHCPLSAPNSPLPWAQVAGVHSQALPDLPNGTFDLDQLELTIREAHGSRYHPRPELICLENTHSSAGGRVLPLTYLRQVRAHRWCWYSPAWCGQLGPAHGDTGAQSVAHGGTRCPRGPSQTSCPSDPQVRGLADRYGLRVHMDGARLMNAAVAQGVEPAQIAQHCDSVTLCFSKVCLCGRGPQGWQGPAQAGVCPLFAGAGLRTHLAGWACTQEGQLSLGQLG